MLCKLKPTNSRLSCYFKLHWNIFPTQAHISNSKNSPCECVHILSALSAHLPPKPFFILGKGHSTRESKSRTATAKAAFNKNSLHQQIGLKFKKESSGVLYLEYILVWCRNLVTWEERSALPGKSWNVVQEKDGDQLDRSSEKFLIFTKSHGKEEYLINNKNNEG